MGRIQKALEAIYNEKKANGEINQVEIAKKTGCSKGQVHHLIIGNRRLNEDNLLAIMDAMGITLADLDMTMRNAEHGKIFRMVKTLLDAGGEWNSTTKNAIEGIHMKFIASQQESMKKQADDAAISKKAM